MRLFHSAASGFDKQKWMGTAGQVFFDNIILRDAGKLSPLNATLIGKCCMQHQQASRSCIDRH